MKMRHKNWYIFILLIGLCTAHACGSAAVWDIEEEFDTFDGPAKTDESILVIIWNSLVFLSFVIMVGFAAGTVLDFVSMRHGCLTFILTIIFLYLIVAAVGLFPILRHLWTIYKFGITAYVIYIIYRIITKKK